MSFNVNDLVRHYNLGLATMLGDFKKLVLKIHFERMRYYLCLTM